MAIAIEVGDRDVQLAWFEQQSWLEIRNAQPDLSFFDGKDYYSSSAIFSRDGHHMYQLDEGVSLFRIDDIDYVLDASLRVRIENDIVFVPSKGSLRIRMYSEREQRWWLIRCKPGDADICIQKYQQEFGWCYVQIQWWIDHRIGPNTVLWIPPQKNIPVFVEAGKKNGKPCIHFSHKEKGDFALQWYRQPLLSSYSTKREYLWVDELGAEIDLSVSMVGDRFVFWSPLGWSLIYQGEEVQKLMLERKPAHFSNAWSRVQSPYREVDYESYNSCLLRGANDLVIRSPRFASWIVRERKFSLCSQISKIGGEDLSGALLWSMNHG